MNKIIVPTDFSSYADHALRYAVEIAKQTEAEIKLLHIMLTPDKSKIDATREHISISGHGDNEYLRNAIIGSQKNLEDLIQSLDYPKVSYLITSGNISQTVVSLVEKEEANLVVMGTQGESGYDALFVGSNAEKIVRMANCPVITIRKMPKSAEINKIVLACDLGKNEHNALNQIKNFQTVFGSELHLLYVNTPANFTCTNDLESKAEKFAKEHAIDDYKFHIYCDYIEDDGINNFADRIDADLIILISHKRRGFARLLSGSVSEGVVGSAHIPVMTFSL